MSTSARWADSFRSQTRREEFHPLERWLVIVTCLHLIAMPWALGTMWWQTQVGSLAASIAAFILCLLPRRYQRNGTDDFRLVHWPKLRRFLPFWLGLALIIYLCVQAYNFDWSYREGPQTWWLQRRKSIVWAPTSVQSPFVKFNLWRQMVIFADSWLLSCSIWVGFTERRSFRILMAALVGNAIALGAVLAIQHSLGNFSLPWAPPAWSALGFTSTFVYKNHAGSYFALTVFLAIALALWSFEYAVRTMKRSSPTMLWTLFALGLVGAVGFTLSRGALFVLAGAILVGLGWLVWWERQLPVRKYDLRLKVALGSALLLFVITAVHYLDFSNLNSRLLALTDSRGYELSVGSRVLARTAAFDLLRDHGLRGIGAGGFRFLFPEYVKHYPLIYQGGQLFWQHAHCDWLEIPIELGLVGDLIIGSCLVWWMLLLFRNKWWNSCVATALLLGCAQTVVHAAFDFPFACPAILATWCSLITVAGRWSELTSPHRREAPAPARS